MRLLCLLQIADAHLEVDLESRQVYDRRELERQRVKHGPEVEVGVEDQEVDEPEDIYRLLKCKSGRERR